MSPRQQRLYLSHAFDARLNVITIAGFYAETWPWPYSLEHPSRTAIGAQLNAARLDKTHEAPTPVLGSVAGELSQLGVT